MVGDSSEDHIIHTLLDEAPSTPVWLRTGPGDDCAIASPDPHAGAQLLAADAMVEGVHWGDRVSPEEVGERLVMVNASDIAACGGRLSWAMLSICLPDPPDMVWVRAFARGLGRGLARAGGALVGGDTTRSTGPVVASLSVGGRLDGPPLLRSQARPGEDLWVSGTLGDAAGGLLLAAPPADLRAALACPAPPLELGPALAAAGLSRAAMDLSDGLATDLRRLCAASGCGADVDPEALPCAPSLAARVEDPLPLQVAFGDDYQLLFSASPSARAQIRDLAGALGLRLTRIGALTEGPVRLLGRPWPAPRWSHFSAHHAGAPPAAPLRSRRG